MVEAQAKRWVSKQNGGRGATAGGVASGDDFM